MSENDAVNPRHDAVGATPGVRIRPLRDGEAPPWPLLLSADPSEKLVRRYLQRGDCRVADLRGRAEDRTGRSAADETANDRGNDLENDPADGAVVGVYVLLETRPETVELVNVAVHEKMQGRGIGAALVRHAVESARRRGFRTIEVGTGNSGVGQLYLYQKCGFRIVGVDRDFFVRHYSQPIVENGLLCRDMIRLSQDL